MGVECIVTVYSSACFNNFTLSKVKSSFYQLSGFKRRIELNDSHWDVMNIDYHANARSIWTMFVIEKRFSN